MPITFNDCTLGYYTIYVWSHAQNNWMGLATDRVSSLGKFHFSNNTLVIPFFCFLTSSNYLRGDLIKKDSIILTLLLILHLSVL